MYLKIKLNLHTVNLQYFKTKYLKYSFNFKIQCMYLKIKLNLQYLTYD